MDPDSAPHTRNSPRSGSGLATPRARSGWDPIWIGYLAAVVLFSPLWGVYGAWRLLVGGSRQGRSERLGLGPFLPPATAPRIWLHGVSVGEVQSLEPVVGALLELRPDLEVVISSETATGWRRAVELFETRAWVRYLPIDLPWTVGGALRRIRPDLIALQESELWPSLLQLGSRRVPVVLSNGRISDRTLRRALWVRPLYRWLLERLSLAGTQTPTDAERLQTLGMPSDAIRVTGNTKFDRTDPVPSAEDRKRWRDLLHLGEDPVLVAGSTFPGEEEILAEALRRVRSRWPEARLVIAPRKVERAPEILRILEEAGLTRMLRTGPRSETAPAAIVLDTIGELATVYGAGDIAFVGRSLTHGGGQSPVEPMAAGLPVLHGPRMENFRQVTRDAAAAGAARTVRSPEELVEAWKELLADPELRSRMGRAGRELVDRNRGAARRSAEMILQTLDATG